MQITQAQRQAIMFGAMGIAAWMAQRAIRERTGYDFAGKSVVITGGSRGLGLVLARHLAEAGAKLTLVARSEAGLEAAAADIRHTQPAAEVLTLAADVRKRYEVEQAVARAFRAVRADRRAHQQRRHDPRRPSRPHDARGL